MAKVALRCLASAAIAASQVSCERSGNFDAASAAGGPESGSSLPASRADAMLWRFDSGKPLHSL